MDVRYRISVSSSAALASPPLPPDSKTLRPESDIFAKGSCGVEPGSQRLRVVTLSSSVIVDWLYGIRKRLVLVL